MKVYIGFFVVALAAASAVAQDTPPKPPQAPTQAAKVNAELAASSGLLAPTLQAAKLNAELAAVGGWNTPMKNSPFSAEEVNESVQTLADGNRIVHNSTSKMYRNSDGRIRRESKGGSGGVMGSTFMFSPSVSIVDPVVRQKYELDSVLKTARVFDLKTVDGVTIAGAAAPFADQKAMEELTAKLRAAGNDLKATEELIAKLKAEGKLVPAVRATAATAPAIATTASATLFGNFAGAAGFGPIVKSRYETKTEDLGTRDFDGVSAEGTRKVTTIPADAIGNERPIEVVYERWFSKDLGVVVYSKTTDPRSGEQTYKLTNIVRSEPDPSLFSVPTEYRKIGQQGATYRIAPVKAATTTKTVATPRVVSNQASGIRP